MESESSSSPDPNYTPEFEPMPHEEWTFVPRDTGEKCHCGRFERINFNWHTSGPALVWKDTILSTNGLVRFVNSGRCPGCDDYLPRSGEAVFDPKTGEMQISFA